MIFLKYQTEFLTEYHTLSNLEMLSYRECGDLGPKAKTLILIHGHLSCSLNFEPLMNYFDEEEDQRIKVIAICLRGFGYSTYLQEISSFKDFAEDIKLFIKEYCKVKEFYVLGHSMGGAVAQHLALITPD